MARKNIDTSDTKQSSVQQSSEDLDFVKHSFSIPPNANAGGQRVHNTATTSPKKVSRTVRHTRDAVIDGDSELNSAIAKQGRSTLPHTGRRVRLLPAVNSIAKLGDDHLDAFSPSGTPVKCKRVPPMRMRATPARTAKAAASYRDIKIIDIDSSDEDEEVEEVEESVFCDEVSESSEDSSSDSDISIDSPVHWPGEKTRALSPAKTSSPRKTQKALSFPGPAQHVGTQQTEVEKSKDEAPSDSDKENASGAIKPVLKARPLTPTEKTTPPPSPSKARLASPSKQRIRIPTPPGRPSLDNFWDANEVNGWNDRHSPKKPPLASASPSKSPLKSPKKSRAEVLARKTFDETKEQLAIDFVAELDQTICQGQIAAATSSTGGIKIIWSKTLNSTAGRASWKRETIRTKAAQPALTSSSTSSSASPSPIPSSHSSTPPHLPTPIPAPTPTSAPHPVTYKHHCTIELALKILTCPDRLHNTLAHEFCHLATYIVSGVKDRPHGPEFKAWGRKCDKAFKHKGVKVTTRHGYEIEFRYLWGMLAYDGGCGREYGRHSKSIDPGKVRCGECKGRLVQVRPAPRGQGKKEVGGFAGFVKEQFAGVKGEMEEAGVKVGHGEVMAELGRRFRARKEGGEGGNGKGRETKVEKDGGRGSEMDDLVQGMRDVVVISDGE
ncbi:SprT-like family-domain-containing protein [Elsinoe ampelina]|uniref:SprT-like family-domain-containing protein n=1 Tax=Elsinoe ampelina TaxID=302913 RepID=A0A6A6GFB7_9PEZI|nr:SprT-like family-domain-containing protein [Elsinoe ampelina]